MPLVSMTGFGRAQGRTAAWAWSWEVRSVNAKGLDIRLRTPPGFDSIESAARALIGQRVRRGSCAATLSVERASGVPVARINRALVESLAHTLSEIPLKGHLRAASLDGLLAVKGVIDYGDVADDEAALRMRDGAILDGLTKALDGLVAMRISEGAALTMILRARTEHIGALARRADESPGRMPEAIKARLRRALDPVLDLAPLDPARLYQEAALIAAKADVREEIDRLLAHTHAVLKLIEEGGAVGRRLDFLAQELSREANTLCAKSNDMDLTAIGLDLKVEVEQFREQVQNVE